jgi:hypothetical protein
MITQFYVSGNSLILKAEVDTPATGFSNGGLLWYHNTYKDLSLSVNISSLLVGNTETEDVEITATFLGLTKLDGIFYVQLFNSEVVGFNALTTPLNNSSDLAVCTNLSTMYSYFLSSLLSELDDIDCNCDNCLESSNILAMIEGIKSALILEKYTIASTLYNNLLTKLSNCVDCVEIPTVDGYNIQTINNVITII